jgi:hypothetical protein
MKVWLDRDPCEANLATCLSCFGQLVRTGVLDRACIMDKEVLMSTATSHHQ